LKNFFKGCKNTRNGFIAARIVAQFATKERGEEERKTFFFYRSYKNTRRNLEHEKIKAQQPLHTPSHKHFRRIPFQRHGAKESSFSSFQFH
jgi:hypothetical protein